MSGGVDSSVAAHLLKRQGMLVEGVFMRNWDLRDERNECPSERDWRDVQKVCRQLQIQCHQINLVKPYWNQVFSVALDEFAQGRTPNPDILCNSQIKFGVLLDEISRIDPQAWFATGHYARLRQASLLRGLDTRKDQSYYLAGVSGTRFGRVLFPLGELAKRDVRRIAKSAGLATAEKEESMGICFVGERRKFDAFLAEYLPSSWGDILDPHGKVVGRHQGMFSKTIGQNARLSGMDCKWYVYAKDPVNNLMYAAPGRTHPLLYSSRVVAGPVHWISGGPDFGPDNQINVDAQVRYMQSPQAGVASKVDRDYVSVQFKDAQFGIASGQYLVLYQGDLCLGSAPICSTT
ncbi:tRNA methyl transferase [Coemansia mojavensis]|nr:tRNA methyl transferase [Coemansia mojavensis]